MKTDTLQKAFETFYRRRLTVDSYRDVRFMYGRIGKGDFLNIRANAFLCMCLDDADDLKLQFDVYSFKYYSHYAHQCR